MNDALNVTEQIRQLRDPSAGGNTLLCSVGGSSTSYGGYYNSWMERSYPGEVSVDGYKFDRFYTIGIYALSAEGVGELRGDVYAVLKNGSEVLLYNHYRCTRADSGQVTTNSVFVGEHLPSNIDISDISKIKIIAYHRVVYDSFHSYMRLYGAKSPWKAE